jgi:hypothetical protein
MQEMNLAAKVAAVSGELIAIPKQRNPQSDVKYAYRSIDDVMNALNPLLSNSGLVITQKVIDRKLTAVTSKSGTPGYLADVIVEMSITDGKETLITQEWATSVDYSDKAPTQAMSMAYKYALIRMFVVTTKDLILNDADNRSPELPIPPTEKQLMEMFLSELAKVNLDKAFIGLNKNATAEKYNRWKNASDRAAMLQTIINELKIIQGDVQN